MQVDVGLVHDEGSRCVYANAELLAPVAQVTALVRGSGAEVVDLVRVGGVDPLGALELQEPFGPWSLFLSYLDIVVTDAGAGHVGGARPSYQERPGVLEAGHVGPTDLGGLGVHRGLGVALAAYVQLLVPYTISGPHSEVVGHALLAIEDGRCLSGSQEPIGPYGLGGPAVLEVEGADGGETRAWHNVLGEPRHLEVQVRRVPGGGCVSLGRVAVHPDVKGLGLSAPQVSVEAMDLPLVAGVVRQSLLSREGERGHRALREVGLGEALAWYTVPHIIRHVEGLAVEKVSELGTGDLDLELHPVIVGVVGIEPEGGCRVDEPSILWIHEYRSFGGGVVQDVQVRER